MTVCYTVIDNRGDALCSDGDACTADACDPPGGGERFYHDVRRG